MTKTIITFSTKVYPTKNQIEYFRKAFGLRRFCWNWGLNLYNTNLNNINKRITNFDMAKILNQEIKNGNYPWMNELNSMIRQESFRDLQESLNKYYKGLKSKDTNSKIFKMPKFKSKKNTVNSFRMHKKCASTFNGIKGRYFSIPTVRTQKNRLHLKLAESINFLKADNIDIKLVSIKEYPINNFTIYITYEKTNHKVVKPNENTKIGIDMGMKTPLTCWDGEKSYKLNPLERIKKAEKKRERLQKKFSKKLESYKKQQKAKAYDGGFKYTESKRYLKLKQQLQRAYYKEECIKKDFREKTTTWLVQNYHIINIEPFTNGFKKSRRAVSRISQYLLYERLKAKAEYYGNEINWISWEPTTQICSSCGHRFMEDEKLTLNIRKYKCPKCNMQEDRDINSAKNIYNLK